MHLSSASSARNATVLYALSPRRHRGLVSRTRSGATTMSWRCPSVTRKASGRPSASTIRWTFVVAPPRERPIAWTWAPLFPGSVLMRSVHSAVDAVPFVVGTDAYRLEEPLPAPLLRPSIEAIEHCLPRAELSRQVSPGNTRSSPPQDSFDEATIVVTGPTCTSLGRDNGLNLLPLQIGQLTSDRHPHVRSFFRSAGEFLAQQFHT